MLNMYDLVLHTEDLLNSDQIGVTHRISTLVDEFFIGHQKYEFRIELRRADRIPPLNTNMLDEQRLADCTSGLFNALKVVGLPLCKYVQKFTYLEPHTGHCCAYTLYLTVGQAEEWYLY